MQAAVRGAGAGPQGSPSAGRAWGRPEAAPYGRRRLPALRAVLLHGFAESAPPRAAKIPPRYCCQGGGVMYLLGHSTISSVPAPMSTHPINDFGVNFSCRNTNASTSVKTTLNLSTGTTLQASPSRSAL